MLFFILATIITTHWTAQAIILRIIFNQIFTFPPLVHYLVQLAPLTLAIEYVFTQQSMNQLVIRIVNNGAGTKEHSLRPRPFPKGR